MFFGSWFSRFKLAAKRCAYVCMRTSSGLPSTCIVAYGSFLNGQ